MENTAIMVKTENRKFYLILGIVLVIGGFLMPTTLIFLEIISVILLFGGGYLVGRAIALYGSKKTGR